jgi:hypothetical protein
MNESSLFIYSVVVLSVMAVGLVLTVIEFRYGEPKKQEKLAKAKAEAAARTKLAESKPVGEKPEKMHEH